MKKIIFISLLMLFTTLSKAQILTEDFEGTTFPPTNWILMENCTDSDDDEEVRWLHQDDFETSYGSFGFAHTGLYSTMSSFSFYGAAEAWLVTPQFTPTASNHDLHFFYKQAYAEDYDSELHIRVSTAAQDVATDFTSLEIITEVIAPIDFEEKVIDLSAYINTPIYIAFVHVDDDGDEWYVDDVTMEPILPPGPTLNPVPAHNATNVQITNTQTSRIDLSWEAPTTGGAVAQYDLWMGHDINNFDILGHPTSMSVNPKIFHFNTTYYWRADAVNMSGATKNVWQFTTCDFPTLMAPYTIDFENGGFVPDGMDQLATNGKFWHYSNNPANDVAHFGNAGDAAGTQTASGGYFAYVDDSSPQNITGISLLSPKIDISSIRNIGVSFYMISNNEGQSNVDFLLKAWDGAAWQTVFSSNSNTQGWEKKIVDLSAFAFDASNVTQFKFVVDDNNSDSADDLAIDDFVIDDLNNLSEKELAIKGLKLFPNPVVDELFIETKDNLKLSKIELFTITGQLIKTYNNTNHISVANLPKGTYLVNIYDQNNVSVTQKITK